MSSIARKYGFGDWHTIYDHPQNQDFRKKRPNPNLLYPGDALFVPERGEKSLSLATGSAHALQATTVKRELRLRLRDGEEKPFANRPYVIEGSDFFAAGHTDGDGLLVEAVPAFLKTARLSLEGREWTLRLAALNPIDDVGDAGVSGVQARLANLGYYSGRVDGALGPGTREAIAAFEVHYGLEVTGKPEGQVLRKLKEVHGT
jgi:N-acetylmuramoyl-L-alanine amidase